MGKGFYFCGVNIAGDIQRARFLGKDNRDVKVTRGNAGNGNAGGFDGQNFIDLSISELALKFLPDFLQQRDIDLVV